MSCDTLPPRSSTAIEKKHAGLIPIAKHERCMYKVHEQLREVSEEAYKPVLLAIGPYNDQGKVGGGFMQQHKLRYIYLQQMLKRTEKSEATYINALREVEESARKCYVDQGISQNSDQFLKMMLLDGCFIIELFHKYEIYRQTKDHKDDPIFQMTWVLLTIARDLLLFENQLSFFVLAKLFWMSENNGSRNSGEVHIVNIEETSLIDLAVRFFSDFLPFKLCKVGPSSFESTENIKHLPYHLMECERLEIGFRCENADFEHLLGLVHASISISMLDVEIDRVKRAWKHQHGSEIREAGVESIKAEELSDNPGERQEAEVVNPLLDKLFERGIKQLKQMNLAMETPCGSESQAQRNMPEKSKHTQGSVLQKAGMKLKNHLIEIHPWMKIPYAIDLQEVGIGFNKAEKLKGICDPNKAEPFNINWLVEAEVEFNKVEKFEHRLHDHKENKDRNTHSATELKEAGIKSEAAKEGNELFIKFNNGKMEISPLTIGDQTETCLRNLIAYEQYCDQDNNFNYITNYVCFMDDLINSPQDVKLLRRSGIIRNYLGDDEATSTMVNKLCHNIAISSKNSIYARTSVDLNRHCSKSCNLWKANLRHDYFYSPWASISVGAAVLLFALAIAQTIISVIH